MFCKLVQPSNIVYSVSVFAAGYINSVLPDLSYNTPSTALKFSLPSATSILSKDVHPVNIFPSISFTDAGITTFVILVLLLKVLVNFTVPSGITNSVDVFPSGYITNSPDFVYKTPSTLL